MHFNSSLIEYIIIIMSVSGLTILLVSWIWIDDFILCHILRNQAMFDDGLGDGDT